MRLTTQPPALIAPILATLATACVGGIDDGTKRAGRGSDDGSGSDTSAACKWIEPADPLVIITSASDFAQLGAPTTGCWDYDGSIRLEGAAIASLDKLGELKSVNDLELVDTGLATFNTKSPVIVYGSLTVTGNSKLTSLANLTVRKFEPTNGTEWLVDYTVRDNAALTSLDGLKNISTVDGELDISYNAALQSIAFTSLKSAATEPGASVRITNNGALKTIDLGRVTTVGRVEIASNVQLTSLTGPAAASIGGDFILRGNRALSAVGTMSGTTEVKGALTIDDNDALADLGALASLRFVASTVAVTNNGALANLGPIARLDGVGSTITITNNPALSTCLAIEVDGCVTSGTVFISGNQTATDCNCWCANTARHTVHN